METRFITELVTVELLGSKYAKLYTPFIYFSKLLNQEVSIPTSFICDYESVPLFKSHSKRAGVIHDYFCRKDSIPIVTKQEAASLYQEAQAHKDSLMLNNMLYKFYNYLTRKFKTLVVRVAPGYFHKHSVLTPLKDFLVK